MTDPAAGTSVELYIKKTVFLADDGSMRTVNIADTATDTAVLVPNGTRGNRVAGLVRFSSACLYSYAPKCLL